MPLNVYVVTEGEYSDYHICGVFSSEGKAKEFTGNKPEAYSIEPWALDALPPRVWGTLFVAQLFEGQWKEWSREENVSEAHYKGERSKGWANDSGTRIQGTSYVSAEHAKKLAVEAQQDFLRRKACR
jgi:hypothetical protein